MTNTPQFYEGCAELLAWRARQTGMNNRKKTTVVGLAAGTSMLLLLGVACGSLPTAAQRRDQLTATASTSDKAVSAPPSATPLAATPTPPPSPSASAQPAESGGTISEGGLNGQPDLPLGTPPAQVLKAVRQVLMKDLRIDTSEINKIREIKVVRVEKVTWPDSCLGVQSPDTMCLQVLTPGYKITFEVQGRLYVYHTDRTGTRALLASPQ